MPKQAITHERSRTSPAAGLFLVVLSSVATLVSLEGGLRLLPPSFRLAMESAPARVTAMSDRQKGESFRMKVRHRLAPGKSLVVKRDDDPRIGYRLESNLDLFTSGTRVRTNELGFRGGPLGTGRPRLVGIGDSVMFGESVEEPKTYMGLLQAALPDVEVVNTSVPGYTTVQEVATLERHMELLQPALVVLGFVSNDYEVERGNRGGQVGVPLLERRSYLYRLLALRARHLGEERRHAERKQAAHEAMRRLAELSRARGFPVIVTLYPGFVPAGGKDDPPFPEVIGLCAEEQLDSLQIYDLVRDAIRARSIRSGTDIWVSARAPVDPHPNEIGHTLIARGLLRKLEERGYLGSMRPGRALATLDSRPSTRDLSHGPTK